MIEPPKTTLSYSTPDVEHDIDRLDQERRTKVEDYNEATFGDRHPWRNEIIRLLIAVAGGYVILLITPEQVNRLLAVTFVVLFRAWMRQRYS